MIYIIRQKITELSNKRLSEHQGSDYSNEIKRIASKDLQIKLIELLTSIIELYNTGDLDYELVKEAKMNNNYYNKKFIIKNQMQP